jgi:hypothetical protein
VTTRNVIGNAVLTLRQRSARMGRGGALGALQAHSRAARNAPAAQRERLKHAAVNAAILSLVAILRGAECGPLLLCNRDPDPELQHERCELGNGVCGYGMLALRSLE